MADVNWLLLILHPLFDDTLSVLAKLAGVLDSEAVLETSPISSRV